MRIIRGFALAALALCGALFLTATPSAAYIDDPPTLGMGDLSLGSVGNLDLVIINLAYLAAEVSAIAPAIPSTERLHVASVLIGFHQLGAASCHVAAADNRDCFRQRL